MKEISLKKHNKLIFLVRFFIYASFGLVIPISFLIWRFDLFSSHSKMTFGGWGVIATIVFSIFMSKLAKQAENCVEQGVGKQTIVSIRKVFIPLLAITLCLWGVSDFIKELVQFFAILTICETISYIANPMFDLLKHHQDDKEENKMIKMARIFWDNR